MKVSELIAALEAIGRPDADVFFHANNHTASPDDRSVVIAGKRGVMIGNFTAENHTREIN